MTKIQDLNNLYEVIKTLKFELKPSIHTKGRLDFSDVDYVSYYEDHDLFFKTVDPIVSLQRSILSATLSQDAKAIVLHKDLIKKIDSDFFYKLKQGKYTKFNSRDTIKLSKENTLSELIKINNNFDNERKEFIKKQLDNLSARYHKYHSFKDDIGKVYTKTDKGFTQKQLAYTIYKTHDIITLLPYKTGATNGYIQEQLKKYFGHQDLENIIDICRKRIKGYNPNIGYELHSFGFNAKAINKKADVDNLQKNVGDLEIQMDIAEEKLLQATNIFDKYDKHFNNYVKDGKERDSKTRGNPPTTAQKSDPKAKEHLKKIKEGNFDYQKVGRNTMKFVSVIPNNKEQGVYYCTGDETYCKFKKSKIDLSVQFGRKKGDFFAKQQELFHQESLTHYARLMRDRESYFVIMIDRDHIDQLENLQGGGDNNYFEIMSYSSLTSKAVEKLIFERDALGFGRNADFQKCKKIREKRSYKQKNSTETIATTDEEKENLKQLVEFMNGAITRINKEIEGNVFDRKPFVVTDDFNDFNVFRKYITKICYVAKRDKISKTKIKELDEKGIINIYQLYNKDFAVHPYCATTERDKNSLTIEKKNTKKPNLFTLYWQGLFDLQGSEFTRLNPESKLYIRAQKSGEEVDNYNGKNASKLRYRKNKLIGSFQLIFYPTKELPFEELQKKIIGAYKEKSYFLGIDVGENSFATICLIDDQKKVVIEHGQPIIIDLSMVNNKGEFVEEKDCLLNGVPYKRKQKLLIEKNNEYFALSDWFSPTLKNRPIKDFSEKELQQALLELEKLAPEMLTIVDTQGNKVFDYVYAIEHLRTTNKILYHLQIFNKLEDEKELIEKELIDSTRLRHGYISKAVSIITGLAKKYNAIIVFENLDQKDYKGITLFSERQLERISGKEKRAYAGLSPYQLLQNKVIQKCNYLLQKDDTNVIQTTPRLKKVEDIKQMNQLKGQKDTTWGSVMFVNEQNSSKECPHCGFSAARVENAKIENGQILRTDNQTKEKKELNLSDDIIKDRRDAYQKVPENLKSKEAGKSQIKTTSIFETRIQKGSLVYGGYLHVDAHDPMVCINCGYDTRDEKRIKEYNLKSCDEVAAYIVAKRGQEFIGKDDFSASL